MPPKPEIYVSIDVEADGPIPGRNNMLSFAAAAFDLRVPDPRVPLTTFTANLDTLPEACPSPATMAWWAKQPEAWAACRAGTRPPEEVMPEFLAWCRNLPGAPVIIGYPVTYDFMFVYYYTMAFGGLADGEQCPFGFQGLDLKTLAMVKLKLPFRQTAKKNMPKAWFDGAPLHTHVALDDAIGQGVMFINMMRDK